MLEFYKGKKVFVTGHTGFKGSWLCELLAEAGAEVTGYSTQAPTMPNLFQLAGIEQEIRSVIGDIRDRDFLKKTFDEAEPEIVFHLAAQPIVRTSYQIPAYTYETNVMGTVNILECVRQSSCTRSFLNVTTDKVYENKDMQCSYCESDPLDGFDPYSNSKSCSELITHSYKQSFFADRKVAVSTARAGNVIGGGDFASDRIIPDCVRALEKGENIIVRNPNSIRPYQHVLESLFAYLLIVKAQYEDSQYADCYNIGPDACDCITTGELVDLFLNYSGNRIQRIDREEQHAVHEAKLLQLDCTKLKETFQWKPKWHISDSVEKTVEWFLCYIEHGDIRGCMRKQIEAFCRQDSGEV